MHVRANPNITCPFFCVPSYTNKKTVTMARFYFLFMLFVVVAMAAAWALPADPLPADSALVDPALADSTPVESQDYDDGDDGDGGDGDGDGRDGHGHGWACYCKHGYDGWHHHCGSCNDWERHRGCYEMRSWSCRRR